MTGTRRLPGNNPGIKKPDLNFEIALWEGGQTLVAGVDEAGRGAWAGPVAAGAVILPADRMIAAQLPGVNDSKKLTPRQRSFWADIIKSVALTWSVGTASHSEIDDLGIVPATRLAMQRALQNLALTPQHVLIDAMLLPEIPLPQTALIKGDARSLTIAAASILAKTARDTYMVQIDTIFPEYGFAQHKGYGTRAHHSALAQCKPCPIHRLTFRPVRSQNC